MKTSFRCSVSCALITEEGEKYDINPNSIKYMVIEDLYYERYMPVIYLSVVLKNEIYSLVIEGEKTSKIFLSINRHNVYSDTALSTRDIMGQFTYILSSSNPNYAEDLSDQETADNSYTGVTLGLMSMEINNDVHTSFNGIFASIDMETLLGKVMEGSTSVVKTPVYNPEFENIMIPSLPSKVKLLEFLFDQCPFYDTNFIYYHDFNKCYLIDRTGEFCDAHDGEEPTVYFDITELTSSRTYQDGMEFGDGFYNIIVNPAKTNVRVNKGYDKVSNQLVYIDDDGGISYMDLNINNNIDSELKQSFNRGANALVTKNNIESNTIFVNIIKEYIDSSLVTPNKEIIIKNYKKYEEYNGKYCLFYKKEILKNINGEFVSSTNFGLKKVGNIEHLGQGVIDAAIRKSGKAGNRILKPGTKTGNGKKNSNSSSNNSTVSVNSNSYNGIAYNGSTYGVSYIAQGKDTPIDKSIKPVAKAGKKKKIKILVPSETSPTCKVIPAVKRFRATDDSILRRDVDYLKDKAEGT